jgi:hypothetical protein
MDGRYVANPYHGNGYWIETRFEFRPTDPLRLNLKLVPWFGSSSFGYAARARFFALGAGSWEDRIFDTDWTFRFRASDLGLQTYGGGLVVQDRPINGGRVEFEHGKLLYRMTVDGTGGLSGSGELYDHHIGYDDDRIGFGILFNPSPIFDREKFPTTAYLDGKAPLGKATTVRAEIAGNRNAPALRLFSETNLDTGRFRLAAKPEVRYYGSGFAGGYRGHVQQGYTGYDLQSISYTNAINIFRTSDAAFVPAARVTVEWQALRTVSVYLDQEIGAFDFRDAPDEKYYFWDAGIRLWPTLPRKDYATIGFTNKLLTAYSTYVDNIGETQLAPAFPDEFDNEANKPRFVRDVQFVVTLHSSF